MNNPLLLFVLAAVLGTPGTATQVERPNIILFVTDDQRDDFLGCAGHPVLRTPVIDGLAADGVRFANAFVTTPICAASRASIFTGAWERRHGYTFGTPPLAAGLVERSYPAVLRKAGYRTGFVGKYGVRAGSEAPGDGRHRERLSTQPSGHGTRHGRLPGCAGSPARHRRTKREDK